jgi:hypothetical protein
MSQQLDILDEFDMLIVLYQYHFTMIGFLILSQIPLLVHIYVCYQKQQNKFLPT